MPAKGALSQVTDVVAWHSNRLAMLRLERAEGKGKQGVGMGRDGVKGGYKDVKGGGVRGCCGSRSTTQHCIPLVALIIPPFMTTCRVYSYQLQTCKHAEQYAEVVM